MDKAKDNAFEEAAAHAGEHATVVHHEEADTGDAAETDQTDFPCSVAQERFWLLDRLEPGNASYNVAVRWRLEGAVSTTLLERAWLRIIERHEILRTVFIEADGVPQQRVLPRSQFKLAEIDLGTLPEDVRQAEGDRIGAIEARAPFDVVTGPLIRATLLRYSPTDSVILVTTHQIVSDGWSIGVMAREMGEIYRALRLEQPEPLEELPLQYADYSMWQLEWLAARGTEAETAYWTKQLQGIKPFRVLPDRPRPAVPTTNGAIASIVLPRDLTNRLQTLAGERAATLFAAALSALSATLSRYTGEAEIVVGTQVSDRDQVELEGMVGQFVNSLILRNDLGGDPRFVDLVERSRDTIAQALEHRHIPIERLLSMVKAERSGVHSALISVNFIFQRTFIQNNDYGDFKLVDLPSLPAGAIYDLNFFMVERPDGWRFSVQYNTDQFESETAYRLLNYVQKTMSCAVRDSSQRISQLALVDADERRRLIVDHNQTQADYPRDASLADLFGMQVAKTPDAIAVIAGEIRLSYRQLDGRANRLARHLIAQGAMPGQRIGVCVERSEDLPIALLAVAKTGAAWVSLDPADPAARLALLAEIGGVALIVMSGNARNHLPTGRVRCVDLDSASTEIARLPDSAPALTIAAESESYLAFVSSSTARPNGIRISQRAFVARLCGLRKTPGMSASDILVAATPASLDLALLEIFLPLISGARLVVASSRDNVDSLRLLQLMQRAEVTVMHGVPSLWSGLVAAEWHGQPRIRVLCSGEGRDRRLAGQLLDRSSQLWALYGCSEATICAAAHRILPQNDVVPIGNPLANTQLYALDGEHQPLPTGAPGELHIGGDCIAIGYLDSSVPEQQRFMADPFATIPGARLFRSGDRVRVRESGDIEPLGRLDLRVTFNGYRIEPGEIEAVLHRHPNVSQSAVVTTRTTPGQIVIEAFVASEAAAHEALAQVLRASLALALPTAMLPGRVTILDALPRNADGAPDRRALRALAVADLTASQRQRATPETEIERRLLKLWSTMLGRSDVDTLANFFELGGHSLLAARMLGRVETEFGRRISLAALFRAPNIRELAQLLEKVDTRDFDFRQVVKLQPVGAQPPVIGINNTGIYYMLAKRLGSNQPFTSLQLFDPSVKSDQLPKTLEEIAGGYVQLIRRVQPMGPYALMGWCVAGALAFEVARQLDEKHGEIAQVYLMDSWVPNYLRNLPKPRSVIADYSLRWQFILADWRKMRQRKLGFRAFLDNRSLVRLIRRLLGRERPAPLIDPDNRQVTPEDYDQWLLGYLQELTTRYQPKIFRGRITLFRSYGEPTGWWFDPEAGWGPFAAGGIDLHMVDGDHFTMFQEPGVSQMAEQITALIEAKADAPSVAHAA